MLRPSDMGQARRLELDERLLLQGLEHVQATVDGLHVLVDLLPELSVDLLPAQDDALASLQAVGGLRDLLDGL